MSRPKLMQVKMTDEYIHKIEAVKKRTHEDTMTAALKSCINIADIVTAAISSGANVIIEEKNGERYRIKVPGILHG